MQLALPSTISSLEKDTNHYFHINLDNPFQIGTKNLNFSLTIPDKIVAFLIGSFVFDEVMINSLYNEKSFLN